MEIFRKHEKVWKIIVAIASLALIVASILPLISQPQ